MDRACSLAESQISPLSACIKVEFGMYFTQTALKYVHACANSSHNTSVLQRSGSSHLLYSTPVWCLGLELSSQCQERVWIANCIFHLSLKLWVFLFKVSCCPASSTPRGCYGEKLYRALLLWCKALKGPSTPYRLTQAFCNSTVL